MKAIKEIKKRLIRNLKVWHEELNDDINFFINKIEEAKDVEDIMRHKKELLITLILRLPLSVTHCYFCIAKSEKVFEGCEKCPYAKFHDICSFPFSDYAKITEAQEELLQRIKKLYYKNEKYDEK